jgi:TM2 domain-containing membrane protein YozV
LFWLLELLQDILDGLNQGAGSFNNSMPPNDVLSEQLLEELSDNKSDREAEEIIEWKAKLRKEYLKDKIKSLISIEQIILVSVIYNITQILSDIDILLYITNTENIIESSFSLLLITNKFKSIENSKINKILKLLYKSISKKLSLHNILITISLIILRIILSIWDVSILDLLSSFDSPYNDETVRSIIPFLIFISANQSSKLNSWARRIIINKILKWFISWLELNNTSIWCVTLCGILKIVKVKKMDDKQVQTTNTLEDSLNNTQSPILFNQASSESSDTEWEDDSIDFAITQDYRKKEEFEQKLTSLKNNPINSTSWVYDWLITQWKQLYPNDYDSDSDDSSSISSTSDLTPDTSKQTSVINNQDTPTESECSTTTNYGSEVNTPTYPWVGSSPEDALKKIREDLPNLPDEVRASVVTMIQGFENLSELAEEDRRYILATDQGIRSQNYTNNRLKGLNIKTKL